LSLFVICFEFFTIVLPTYIIGHVLCPLHVLIMDTDYKKLVVNGVLYTLAGTLAVVTAGAIYMRSKLKPKNSWSNSKTLQGRCILLLFTTIGI